MEQPAPAQQRPLPVNDIPAAGQSKDNGDVHKERARARGRARPHTQLQSGIGGVEQAALETAYHYYYQYYQYYYYHYYYYQYHYQYYYTKQ